VDRVIRVAGQALERVWPDLTVILDVDLATAATRIQRELDRMERKGHEYHQRVREGFLELAQGREGFVVIDAARDVDTVHAEVVQAVDLHGPKPV